MDQDQHSLEDLSDFICHQFSDIFIIQIEKGKKSVE